MQWVSKIVSERLVMFLSHTVLEQLTFSLVRKIAQHSSLLPDSKFRCDQ